MGVPLKFELIAHGVTATADRGASNKQKIQAELSLRNKGLEGVFIDLQRIEVVYDRSSRKYTIFLDYVIRLNTRSKSNGEARCAPDAMKFADPSALRFHHGTSRG